MTYWQIHPVTQPLSGQIKVPGDKSISHRSIMFGALANGTTTVSGFLAGEDCLATQKAFSDMGVKITTTARHEEGDELTIVGVGSQGLLPAPNAIDVGNSGTGMRLLSGVLAGQTFSSTLIGDSSLMKRPMRRVAEPLNQMGAHIQTSETGTAPLKIQPSQGLKGINYQQNVASAQVKSAILFATLYSQGTTTIHEPGISRDHTERMLRQFGASVNTEINNGNVITRIEGGQTLKACHVDIPADISSAAFFMVAAALKGDITLTRVGINPTRTGIIEILKAMGAEIHIENQQNSAEPFADIRIKQSNLKGIVVPKQLVPLAIDEFPAIFIAAACASGTFELRDAKELRVKESDRIQSMADGLVALGVDCEVLDDGIIIKGNPENPFPHSQSADITINSHGDHRIAMAFAMASLFTHQPFTVLDTDNVSTSFPNFLDLATRVGLKIDRYLAD